MTDEAWHRFCALPPATQRRIITEVGELSDLRQFVAAVRGATVGFVLGFASCFACSWWVHAA